MCRKQKGCENFPGFFYLMLAHVARLSNLVNRFLTNPRPIKTFNVPLSFSLKKSALLLEPPNDSFLGTWWKLLVKKTPLTGLIVWKHGESLGSWVAGNRGSWGRHWRSKTQTKKKKKIDTETSLYFQMKWKMALDVLVGYKGNLLVLSVKS
jgi:hypothetical protein